MNLLKSIFNIKLNTLFLLGSFVLFSHAALTGRVIDQDGQPIAAADVSLKGLQISTQTDFLGNFSLEEGISKLSSLSNLTLSSQLNFNSSGLTLDLAKGNRFFQAYFLNSTGQIIHRLAKSLNPFISNTINLSYPSSVQNYQGVLHLVIKTNLINHQTVLAPLGIRGSGSKAISHNLKSLTGITIDTLQIHSEGYVSKSIPIESYDSDLGDVKLSVTSLPDDNFYRIQIKESNTETPNFVNALVSVQDIGNLGINGLSNCWNLSTCSVYTDGVLVQDESSVEIETALDYEIDDRTILLLDISTSITAAQLDSVLSAAKNFVKLRIGQSPIALYTFSSEVTVFNDFTSDSTELFTSLDLVKSIGPYGASTKLWGAIDTALTNINHTYNIESKNIERGNIVVFTDGTDTEGSKTLNDVIASQTSGENLKEIWFVLGNWNGVIDTDFKTLSNGRIFKANNPDDLNSAFNWINEELNKINESYYALRYASPKRDDVDHSLLFKMASNANNNLDNQDSIQFNSANFVDGYPPEAINMSIVLIGDSLFANYEYYDPEGIPEGPTTFDWGFLNTNGAWGTIGNSSGKYAIRPSSKKGGEKYIFRVTPAQLIGTPKYGVETTITYTYDFPPYIQSASILGSNTQGSTLNLQYTYKDAENHPESGTEIQWYHYNTNGLYTPIDTAKGLSYEITYADSGKIMAVGILAKSSEGVLRVANSEFKRNLNPTKVTGWNKPVANSVLLQGNFALDQEVSFTYTYFDQEGDLENGTTFQWYRDTLPIAGATQSTYTITEEDAGLFLSVKVTPKTNTQVPFVGDAWSSDAKWVSACIDNKYTDPRDNRTYGCTKIGQQTWMTEDLKYDIGVGEQSDCYQDNNYFCEAVGRLYRGDFVSSKKDSLCPEGWVIPDSSQWKKLFVTTGNLMNDTTHALYKNSNNEYLDQYRVGRFLQSDTGWVTSVSYASLAIPNYADSAKYPDGTNDLGMNIQPTTYKNNGSFQGYRTNTVNWKNGTTAAGTRQYARYWVRDGSYRHTTFNYTGWVTVYSQSYYYSSTHIRCVQDFD